MGYYIMLTRIRLLLLICPYICSFLSFSQVFSTEIFDILLLETIRLKRLKLVTPMDSVLLYSAYLDQAAAAANLSLYLFIFPYLFLFFVSFQALKSFVTVFLRNCEAYKLLT